MVARKESGKRRIQVAALPELARLLSTTLEELFGQQQETTVRKRGPAPKWQQQLETIDQLPKSQQKFVAQMLDALIAQATTKASSEGRGGCSKQIKQHRREAGAIPITFTENTSASSAIGTKQNIYISGYGYMPTRSSSEKKNSIPSRMLSVSFLIATSLLVDIFKIKV
ncbi:hypothetical protein [Pseudomonas sp. SBB6]|uniref:hypothetical protein n=1 Tax=Pseudomonas sp. SBB6 TaxID=2962032 RepID=UPI0020B6A439|nr:hypothetical protein [Pseudomonas sp. SBB6]MCP3749533.1 hypothetical protein [Pseudomonas sp. SBB6]